MTERTLLKGFPFARLFCISGTVCITPATEVCGETEHDPDHERVKLDEDQHQVRRRLKKVDE